MKKLLSFLSIILLTSCTPGLKYEVTSFIYNKDIYTRNWVQFIKVGSIQVPIYHVDHHYYFYFNELDVYKLEVSSKDYNNYNIGDSYTFTTKDSDLGSYFYANSYTALG